MISDAAGATSSTEAAFFTTSGAGADLVISTPCAACAAAAAVTEKRAAADVNTKTLQAWYYTLLLKVLAYKLAADDYSFYGALIRNPLAFFVTVATVLQTTEMINESVYIFYVYFGIQVVCNLLTLLNMKFSYAEKATMYKTLAQKYEGKSIKVRDMLNMNDCSTHKLKILTHRLEIMITRDESTSITYEERAQKELEKHRRLFKYAGMNLSRENSEEKIECGIALPHTPTLQV